MEMESEYRFDRFDNSGDLGQIGLVSPNALRLKCAARGIIQVPGD